MDQISKILILIISLTSSTNICAQFSSAIEISLNGGNEVITADINGDSYLDIVTCGASNVYWYENLDGEGNFGNGREITSSLDDGRTIWAADLDGDDDIDVIAGSQGVTGQIVWYENLDGLGNFSGSKIIEPNAVGTQSIMAANIDGDSDLDLIYANFVADEIGWYENLDGNGNFGSSIPITNMADGAISVFSEDIDGDFDIDLLSASLEDNKIAWYENIDGNGSFGPEQLLTISSMGAYDVVTADMDGDLDIDVVAASQDDGNVVWFENLDGFGTFGVEQVVTNSLLGARSVDAVDLDGDDDIDIVGSSFDLSVSKVVWYRNLDGNGNFGSEQLLGEDDGFLFIDTGKIDSDNDYDIVGVDSFGLFWWENLHPLSVEEFRVDYIQVYPNPADDIINLVNMRNIQIESVTVFDVTGKEVMLELGNVFQLDVGHLNNGLYLIRIGSENGNLISRFVKQ